jgi:hypothetical protein
MQDQYTISNNALGIAVSVAIFIACYWFCRKWFLEGYRRPPITASQAWRWDDTVELAKVTATLIFSVIFLLVFWAIAIIVVLAVIIWAFRTVFG